MTQSTARPAGDDTLRRWPADPSAFTDTTRCPACLTALRGPVCAACGLDLSAPEAGEVLASGRRIVAEELRRQGLIDDMFAAQRAARAREAARATAAEVVAPPSPAVPMPAVPMPAVVAPVADAAVAAPAAPAAPPVGPSVALPPPPSGAMPVHVPAGVPPVVGGPPAGAAQTAEPRGPRRSGMQVFLLTLGVVLISVTAIVFLFVAYLIASLEVRSVIIAVASALVLGVAALLRARRLPGTAEGVAVVAVVLLLLDVWIVRANDLFGSGAARPVAYAGIALLVLAAVLTGVRAVTRIRTLGVSAAVLAPTSFLLLGIGAAPADEPGTAAWLGGVVALVPAIGATRVKLPVVERVIVLGIGAFGGLIAWCAASFALPDVAWHPVWTFLAVAVAWSLLLLALVTRGRDVGVAWQWVSGAAAGSAVAAAPAVGTLVEASIGSAAWVAPVSAVVVATALSATLRLGTPPARRIGVAAFAGAAAIAVLAAVPAVFAGVARIAALVISWTNDWRGNPLVPTELTVAAVIVPFALAAASAVVAFVVGRASTLGAIPVALAGYGVIVVGASFGRSPAAVAVLLACAAAALGLAVVAKRLPIRGLLGVLAVAGPLAAALAWAIGFGDTGLWAWSSAGALALTLAGWALASRIWRAQTVAGATTHALLVALEVVVIALALAPWLVELGISLADDWRAPTVWAALIAGALFGIAVFLPLHRASRLAFSAPLLAASTIAVVAMLVTGGTALRSLCALVVALAAILWVWRGRLVAVTPAAAAVAPVMLTFAAAWFVGDILSVPAQADAAAGAAVLVGAALAHLVSRGAGGVDRATGAAWAASAGALTLVVAALGFLGADWLPLALVAPVPFLLAALWGEPFASASPARHIAWASVPLGVAAWWTWLVDADATVVELFSLPVAALCLALGALVAVRRPVAERASGRVSLVAVGLAIAVLPSVASAADAPVRTILLVAIGAVIVLASAFAPARVGGVPVGLLGVIGGTTAAVGGALVHALEIASDSGAWTAEWWSLAGLAVGVGASIWWARAGRAPQRLAEWIFAASIIAAAAPTILAIAAGWHLQARALVLLPLLAVLHILTAAALPRPVSGAIGRWTTAGVLGVASFVAILARVEPYDLVLASIAAALIGAGVLDLMRRQGLGSWPALGVGLAVLLVPALVADFTAPELWRIVALGVVALAALLAGIVWKLQAPFVLGGVVLLVHAVAQLWPWITLLYEAVWWWLWLGIAGVLLVVIAATYERQLRTARKVVTRIAALR